METTTYNDTAVKRLLDEISSLSSVSFDESWHDSPVDELVALVGANYTHCGKIMRKDAYGFVDDIFVPPRLASPFNSGETVVVQWQEGPKGCRAQRIVKASTYVDWHAEEICSAYRARIEADNKRYADYLKDKVRFWESLKERTLQMGHTLIEFSASPTRTTYGGAGVDVLVLDGTVTPSEARAMLRALGLLHESDEPGSFEHGRDDITVAGNTITNKWVGPWTD